MWQFFSFFLPLLAFAAMTLLGIAPALRWKLGRDLPLPKGGYGSGFLDGKLILAGGTHWKDGQKLWLDETVAYDPQGRSMGIPAAFAQTACLRSIGF